MILDVDIGNSRLKWRLGQATGAVALDELGALIAQISSLECPALTRVRAACVAGSAVEQQFSRLCMDHWSVSVEYARVINGLGGVKVAYQQPAVLGVDRWLAMLAAYRAIGRACVVIDVGSALTVDFIDVAGNHIGGLIMPGAGMMAESLFQQTSAVKVAALTLPQKWQPGCDTVSCVENAVAAAFTGLVREIIEFGIDHCGPDVAFLICGGDAQAIACRDSRLRVQPYLVLDGLSVALS